MKRIIFTLIITFFCANVWAQCPTGDITFTTQTEIDDFVSNYSTCDTIFGDLNIGVEFQGTSDLSGLSFITTITGSLSLHQVSNLTGLESITHIGGDLRFVFSSVNIGVFDHEMYIGGDIIILDSYLNCAVQAFCDFVEMGGTIIETYFDYNVPYNLCLINIQNNCPGPSGCPTGDIEIVGQASADSFGASNPDCTVIEGNLIFRANSYSVDVTTGFANIERINGDLWVRSVEVVGVFTNLDTIMGDIIVQDFNADGNSARLNASFPALKYVEGNIRTSEFEGAAYNNASFPALERVEGGFSVCGDNLAVTNCGDCVSLQYIGGSVEGVVGGLNHVDTIIGSIHPEQCYNSPTSWNTSGYNELKYLGGDLIMEDSDGNDVDSITGFQQLTTIGGTFWCGNPGMGATDVEITGLGQLKHAGSIVIYFYDLTNLDFLSQLESVSNELRIVSSDRLTDISGLNHPLTIGGTLIIQSNPQLSECAVQAVCEHLVNQNPATISNNMPGCNSVQEIEAACGVVQNCPSGNVIIYCQDQMDEFAAQYPNCTEINGDFRLSGDEFDYQYNFGCHINVNLPNLTRINGTLRLRTNVSGLDSLRYVGGISVSPTGSAILPLLDSVAGSVNAVSDVEEIYYTVQFPDCPQLKYIGGNLSINTYFGGFDSNKFPALEYVGGNILQNHNPFYIGANVNISDFSGMNNLRYVGGNIVLSDGNISGFNALDTIGGHFFTTTSYLAPIPVSITGLNQLRYIGGRFELADKAFGANCVSDLSGLQELNYIGGDFEYSGQSLGVVENCDNLLDSINGMSKLKYVSGSLRIINNDLLHLNFLNQLEMIGGNLELTDNALGNIEGLNHAVDIGGEVIITNNTALAACAVQAVCDHLNASGATLLGYNSTGCNSVAEIIMMCVPTADTIDGSIDTDFGTNGVIDIPSHDVAHILTQPDDKIIVFGNSILRLNPDGTLDTSFGTNGVASVGGFEGVLQPDGKIVVMSADQLARLNPDGTLDATFGTGGTRSLIVPAKSIALSPDGKIITSDTKITRYNADGSIDTTFGASGIVRIEVESYHLGEQPGWPNVLKTYYPSCHVVVQSDGKIIVAGDFYYQSRYNGYYIIYFNQRRVYLRYNTDGTLDDSFNNWTEDWVQEDIYKYIDDLLLLPNDEFTILTSMDPYGFLCTNRIDANGTNISEHCDYVSLCEDPYYFGASWGKAVQADCGIFAFGKYGTLSSNDSCSFVTRTDFDGTPYTDFGDNGNVPLPADASFDNTASIALQSDGRIIIAGNSATGTFIARLHNDEACAVSLPIETLDPLQVYLKNNTALLTWRTATETNNEGFEIQRSKDGINWTRIGWQAGQGNALTPHSYTYTDENPLFGTSYYLFKQVDFTGDFTYSNVVTLQYTRPGVTIFPNPNAGIFDVQATTQGTYKILNTSGQIIQTGELENNISIDISSYAQGIYFMSVQINNDMTTKRIIKM